MTQVSSSAVNLLCFSLTLSLSSNQPAYLVFRTECPLNPASASLSTHPPPCQPLSRSHPLFPLKLVVTQPLAFSLFPSSLSSAEERHVVVQTPWSISSPKSRLLIEVQIRIANPTWITQSYQSLTRSSTVHWITICIPSTNTRCHAAPHTISIIITIISQLSLRFIKFTNIT